MRKAYWLVYFLPTLIVLIAVLAVSSTYLTKATAKLASIQAVEAVPVAPVAPVPRYAPLPFPDPPPGYVPTPAKAPKPRTAVVVAVPEPGHAYAPSCVTPLMPLQGWNDQPNKDQPGVVHTNLRVAAKSDVRAHPCLEAGKVYHLPYGRAVIGGKLPKE